MKKLSVLILTISTLNSMALQPVKSTTATKATQTTQATTAVTPIGQSRYKQMTDGLDKLPEVKGETKTKTETAPAYQWYSLAKYFPSTSTTGTSGTSTSSEFYNTFLKGTYNEFLTQLKTYNVPAQTKTEFVSDRYGTAYVTPAEKAMVEKYGLRRGIGWIESMAKAEQTAKNAKNPMWRPIIYDAKTFTNGFYDQTDLYKASYDGNNRRIAQPWDLTQDEVGSLIDIAKSQNLGQFGLQDLINKTYQKKYIDQTTPIFNAAVTVLNDPYNQSWNPIKGKILFPESVSLNELSSWQGGASSDKYSKNFFSTIGGQAALQGITSISPLLQGYAEGMQMVNALMASGMSAAQATAQVTSGAATMAGASGGILAGASQVLGAAGMALQFYSLASGAISQHHAEKYMDRQIEMFTSDGKLKTSIEQFNGPQKDAIEYIAKAGDMKTSDLISGMSAYIYDQAYNRANKIGLGYTDITEKLQGAGSLVFDNGQLKLSNSYNPYATK